MNQDSVLLVTGGAGDIGSAILKHLHGDYEYLYALDIQDEASVSQWLQELHEQGYKRIAYRQMNVADYNDCERVIGGIVKTHQRIDALVNNAGITRDAVFSKMTLDHWNAVLRVNLDSMFCVSKPVVENMRARGCGRIVNISSVNAQKGQFSQTNYAAAKAGIYGFTKSLAQELMSKNITVNSISPGYVNTRLMKGIRPDILADIIANIPAKRLAEPEEVAYAVAFLLDEKSGYITGANLSINGGLHMY